MKVSRIVHFGVWAIALGAFATALQGAAAQQRPASPAPAPVAATEAVAPGRQPAAAPAVVPGDISSYRTVVDRYCIGCHNDRMLAANLSLQGIDLTNTGGEPNISVKLEKVVMKLRAGAMPPQGSARPDAATLQGFVNTLEQSLDRAAAARPNPGRTETFHRLNRAEYRNAVRDLLGVDVEVESLLPQDQSSFGFDNIAGVLKLSTTVVERYAVAATKLARLAIGASEVPPTEQEIVLRRDVNQQRRLEDLPLGTRGGVLFNFWAPLDGEYEFTIRLTGGEAAEPTFVYAHTLEMSVDGEQVFTHDYGVRKERSFRPGLGILEPGRAAAVAAPPTTVEAVKKYPGLQVRVPLKAGPRAIAVTFPKKTAALPTFRRDWFALGFGGPGDAGGDGGGTLMLPGLSSVGIAGPFNPTGPGDTPSRRLILTCKPTGAADETRCGRQILSALARRAYRRPVTTADLQPLMERFGRGRTAEGGTFERGIEEAIQLVLVNAEFLFRIEREPAAVRAATYRINDFELASRLSFFVWSSIPDEPLLKAAEQGTLRTPAGLRTQVRRMLTDRRSEEFVHNFTGQWLGVRSVQQLGRDVDTFPDFEAGLREAYQQETEMFFTDILRNPKASAIELLSADYTYVNERLATFYGIPNVYGDYFRKVSLANGSRLGGLLGQGSVLMATATPTRTAPTIRGKFILATFLGTPPPEPPPNIPALPENVGGGVETKIQTVRERLATHRRNPTCAGCHNVMDPLGLSLENFDAVGRWRDVGEDGTPIDASVVLFDGTKLNGAGDLRAALLKRPDNFLRTLTERLMTFALGRGVEYYDQPTIRKIVRDAEGQTLESLLLGIVSSDAFQMRRSAS